MIAKVEMTGFAIKVEGISTAAAWLYVNLNPRPPDDSIRPLSPRKEVIEWAEEQLVKVGIVDKCYLSLSCVGPLPWFEFTLPNGPRGLADYWSRLLVKSALIIGREVIRNLHFGERWFAARYYPIQPIKASLPSAIDEMTKDH